MLEKIHINKRELLKRPFIFATCCLLILVLIIFIFRYHAYLVLKRQTNYNATTTVSVVKAQATSAEERIFLPGSVLAWHEAPIYARAKGYLKVWYVDIGYKVKKGDVLAIIERPELDAELREAEDYLKVVTAQNELAQITARRWNRLVVTDSVSKQANDNKTYEAAALTASLSKARANLEKLKAYVSFEQIVAPFTGTISLRQTDIGALINIGSNPAQAQPLFRIVQTDPLRLYVNIPQMYSSQILPEMTIQLRFIEHPGKVFPAKLLKTAGAINPTTLTLQAEFEVQNKDNILLPGSYTLVEFAIPSLANGVILPVNTLIFQKDGLQVATVDAQNHVQLKNIEIATDFGKEIQINSGVEPGEKIILNPPDYLQAGEAVRIVSLHSPGENKSTA